MPCDASCDGHGLKLRLDLSGARRWLQRLVIHGKRRDLGLRTFPLVSLAEAREQALENRKLARAGGDPAVRRPDMPSFAQAAEKVIEHRFIPAPAGNMGKPTI